MAKKVMSSEVIQPNLFNDTINSADALIEKLTELNTEFKKTAEVSKEVIKNSKFDSVKSMNDLVKATENATKTQKLQLQVENELNKALKLKTELQEKLNKAELVAEKVNNEKLRGTILQTKEDERQAKATERKIVAETRLQSAYNRVNTWLGKLRNEYRDLAIKKELGAQLTAKEEFRYSVLEKRINSYDSALKKVDGTMGMHQRNVGNYASGWNGLGNSINQLSREMPAFANSVSTGFMAISNNLPMLFDELQRIKKANVELKSQGIQTKSALLQVGTALFSWQTALSLGVTLLTLYGSKMVDFVINYLNPADKKLDEINKKRDEENKKRKAEIQARKEQADFIGKESFMYIGLINALKQTNKGTQERKDLIKTINEQYGTTLKNIHDETLFQNQLSKSVTDYLNLKRYEYRLKANEENINKGIARQENIRLQALKLNLPIEKQLITDILDGKKKLSDVSFTRFLTREEEIAFNKFGNLVSGIKSTNEQLEKWGYNSNKLRIIISESDKTTNKTTKTTKKQSEAQKELNEYTSKYLSILAKIIDVQNLNKIESKQGELDTEISKQTKSAELTGEFDMEKIKSILEEIEVLKLNANYAEYQANEDLIKEKYDALQKEYEAKRDEYKKDSKEYLHYQEQLKKIEKDRLAEQDLNFDELMQKRGKVIRDSAKEEIDIKKEIAEADKKFEEEQFERKKKNIDIINKLAQSSADLFVYYSNKKIKATEDELTALKKQQDFMQNLAVNGNILAQQSLAQNEKLQAEANKKKEQELKKQAIAKMSATVFEAYSKNASDKDVKNPVVKTITDVSLLQAFIASLPKSADGTETTVGAKFGAPHILGVNQDEYITRVDKDEKILSIEDSRRTGHLTTKQIAQLAEDKLRGKLMYKGEATQTNVGFENILLLNEITELKEIIKSKPEMNIQMGEIVGGVMHLVESTKVRNTTTRNIHRFNNKI